MKVSALAIICKGPYSGKPSSSRHPPAPLKAGYTAHSTIRYRMQVQLKAVAICHKLEPPRMKGHRLHAIVDRPSSLTPSTSPQLGVESQHQELHRCARDGFLGPPSKQISTTRILHHLLMLFYVFVNNIITHFHVKTNWRLVVSD